MQVFLSRHLNHFPGKIKLSLLAILCPLFFHAQSLTGLWVGTVNNDSASIRKDQSFEIALTEYRGKVYGYSRNEFIVDDVLYYIVKRVKGTIDGNTCEVTDDEIVSHNFPNKPDKNVRVTSTFRRNETDSSWQMDGKWKTNATKKYYTVTGTAALAEEKDPTASKIFPHLEELNLANEVAFYKERKEGQPILRLAKPERTAEQPGGSITINQPGSSTAIVQQQMVKPGLPVQNVNAPVVNVSNAPGITSTVVETGKNEELVSVSKPSLANPGTEIKKISADSGTVNGSSKPSAQPSSPTLNNKPLVATVKPKQYDEGSKTISTPVQNSSSVSVNSSGKQQPVSKPNSTQPSKTANPTPGHSKNNTAVIPAAVKETNTGNQSKELYQSAVANKETAKTNSAETAHKPTMVELAPKPEVPKPDVTLKAAMVSGRKSEFSQQVNFKSDSLQISLYDNGEIDGDTVSIYMNGEVIMARQGLKSSAIRKTIYIRPGVDEEFTLVLFAENLGKYPPNTGLLVVRDGDDIYNLRFSSDFQKNAGIIFRRKK